jgi:hypothetical protein
MIISFDLDDTLIPGTKQFETVARTFLQKLWKVEKLRVGTVELMKACQARGHKVYVYTTSYRPPRRIWWMFYLYGIKLDKVINQQVHNQFVRIPAKPSKYPPAFKIDLHIDDSKGVEIEGQTYNFRTVIVREDNPDWAVDILAALG